MRFCSLFLNGLVFALSMGLAISANATSSTINIVSYGGLSSTNSGELLLLVESLVEDAESGLKIVAINKGIAYRKGDTFVLTTEDKARSFLELIWKGEKRSRARHRVFETQRSLMALSQNAPSKFVELVRGKREGYSRYSARTGRFWNMLSETKAMGGELSESKFPYYVFQRREWQQEKEWHLSFFMSYVLELDGVQFSVDVLPKSFGGLWRLQAVLKEKPRQKNSLYLGTGNIVPSVDEKFTEKQPLQILEQFGEQYVVASSREILGKQKIVDPYLKGWNQRSPIHFLSANVYQRQKGEKKERLLFQPYEIVELAGKKVAIVALSSPGLESRVEKASTAQPWLKDVVIKKPEGFLQSELLLPLRKKTDFIILLTNMTKSELGDIDGELSGVDLVVQQAGRNYTPQGIQSVDFSSHQERLPRLPMMTVPVSDIFTGFTEVNWRRGDIQIQYRQRALDLSVSNDGEDISELEDYFFSLFTAPDVVLPDHREIYPTKIVVGKEEFARLAAEMMRQSLEGEIGIFNIQTQNSDMPGKLDATILKTWVRGEEQLMVTYLLGRDIKAIHQANQKAEDPHRLAFAGLDAKGMLSGAPLQDNEVYRVITSTAVGNNSQFYPPTEKAVDRSLEFIRVDDRYVEQEGAQRVALVNFLTEVLRKEWEQSKSLSKAERKQRYKRLYEGTTAQKEQPGYWVHDFKSVRLEYSSLATSDVSAFGNVVDSRLVPADQRIISGAIDYAAIYRKKPYISELGVKGQFSKVEFNPDADDEIESVVIDDLVYFANIGWPAFTLSPRWKALAIKSGPIYEFAYDTEFEKNSGSSLERNLQSFLGWRFYGGQWIKSLTLAGLNENRLTEGNERVAWGLNGRFDIAKPLAENIVWRSNFDYRYFFESDEDTDQDLESRLIWDNYLDVKIFGKLSFGPYFRWTVFKGQTFEDTATQTTVGLSFSFRSLWKPKYQSNPF